MEGERGERGSIYRREGRWKGKVGRGREGGGRRVVHTVPAKMQPADQMSMEVV